MSDNYGVAFAGRRQSKDLAQRKRLLSICTNTLLYMAPYTCTLYRDMLEPDRKIIVSEALTQAPESSTLILETESPDSFIDLADRVIIYIWGRTYPATVKFDPSKIKGWNLTSLVRFPGTSHKEITEQIWERPKGERGGLLRD